MQSQYPVVEAVLIGTRAIVFVLFRWILQAPRNFRKTLRRIPSGRDDLQMAFNWERRYGVPMFSRNSVQSVECILINTSTTFGSNCVPEHRWISSCACLIDNALRYTRSEVMASSASATAKILAPRGISSPRKPRG